MLDQVSIIAHQWRSCSCWIREMSRFVQALVLNPLSSSAGHGRLFCSLYYMLIIFHHRQRLSNASNVFIMIMNSTIKEWCRYCRFTAFIMHISSSAEWMKTGIEDWSHGASSASLIGGKLPTDWLDFSCSNIIDEFNPVNGYDWFIDKLIR